MPKNAVALQTISPAITPAPNPATKAAIRRCRAAWKRAFDAYIQEEGDSVASRIWAGVAGDKAYRKAMPLLADHNGIREFIACTAHGIAIQAISPNQSGKLLYAAQVAIEALQRAPKPPKTPLAEEFTPPPSAEITHISADNAA